MNVSGQLHAPAALPSGKSTLIGQEVVYGPESVWTLWRRPCRESNSGRPVRSPLLYRLSYPGSLKPLIQPHLQPITEYK
jgi:hypothetical protein